MPRALYFFFFLGGSHAECQWFLLDMKQPSSPCGDRLDLFSGPEELLLWVTSSGFFVVRKNFLRLVVALLPGVKQIFLIFFQLRVTISAPSFRVQNSFFILGCPNSFLRHLRVTAPPPSWSKTAFFGTLGRQLAPPPSWSKTAFFILG